MAEFLGELEKWWYLCFHKWDAWIGPSLVQSLPCAAYARVAELVDALVSGTSGSNAVQVRFLFRALIS